MANEVAKRDSFSTQLTTTLNEVKGALPDGFNIPRFVQNAVALLNENEQLKEFAQKHGTTQIKHCLMKGAYLGLDAMNKECHLVPYGSKLNFVIDYRGSTKLAKKYSPRKIRDIFSKLVRQGDEFAEAVIDGVPQVAYRPMPFNCGPILGAFAVCVYEDGGIIYETMSLEELEKTRKVSKANNSMAWRDFTGEMYKKTVLHRLCKNIDLEFESAKQIEYFAEDMAIETDTKKIVESEIAENANKVEFVDVDAEIVDAEVVEELPPFMTQEEA